MRPLRLAVEGFTCFKRRQEVDFSDLDLFVVSGPTGAGKSSLLDAMIFALYGRVPRMGARGLFELVSHGADSMSVQLDFTARGRTYRIARRVRRSGRSQAELEELLDGKRAPIAGSVREVDTHVQRILGLRYDAFTQAVVLPQGEFHRFLKSEPRDRREILRDLLRLQIYERMRQRAVEQANAARLEVQNRESRLAEEYAGADETMLGRKKRELEELRARAEEKRLVRDRKREELEAVQDRHEKTRELEKVRQERSELLGQEEEIRERRKELELARKAREVEPVRRSTEALETRARTARERAVEMRTELEKLEKSAAEAREALACREAEAERIPSLRRRIPELGAAERTLEQLESARKRLTEAERERTRREKEAEQAKKEEEKLSERAAELEALVAKCRKEVEGLGYSPELDEALERLREPALELRRERQDLARYAGEIEKRRREYETARSARERAEALWKAAAEAVERAEGELARAEARRREAERTFAAAVLRENLEEGKPCPVCEQDVTRLPPPLPAPELETARLEERRAAEALREARAAAESARAEKESALAEERAATERLEESRRARSELEADIRLAEERLSGQAPPPVHAEREATVEEKILALASRLAALRGKFREAEEKRRGAETELAKVRAKREGAATRKSDLAARLREAERRLEDFRHEVRELEERLREVSPEGNPRQERERIESEIARLEKALEEARRRDRKAERDAAAAREKTLEAERSAERVEAEAREARRDFEEALRARGFTTPDDLRRAFRADEEMARTEKTIREWEESRAAVERRLRELENDLRGRTASDEELQGAKKALETAEREHEEILRAESRAETELRDLEERVATAGRLREELERHRTVYERYRLLAEDLKSDAFQAFVLEETFRSLVRGASARVRELSGRYTFEFRDDAFYVVDHDNAREERSTDTLSGGETFLASLALALELSEQVQRAAGAVQLDSLFVDEGFGTLDPETLDTVASAIESLRVGGRMVGIVTHIPELTARLPQRIRVEKRPEGSRVRVERED